MNNTYLYLLIGTIFFPLVLSFDKKVAFYKKIKYLIPASLITATVFVVWDIWFTDLRIWGFNSNYVLGYYFYHLPIEEVAFFFIVPYACLFIYECARVYLAKYDSLEELHRWITFMFFGMACSFLYWFNDKLYTGIVCLVVTFILGTHLIVIRRRYMGWFYVAFFISLIPMLVINGILTSKPVVFYDHEQNSGIQLGTIPLEDFLYNLSMLAMCTGLYEWFKRMHLRYQLRHQKLPS